MDVKIFLIVCIVRSLQAFDDAPTLDPMIPTMSPHDAPTSDSCVGQCAFKFVDQLVIGLGPGKSSGLLNLNYNDFLTAFSNTTFFEEFCSLFHGFKFCYTKCPHGYMQELLLRSSEIIDHFCVYNYQAIAHICSMDTADLVINVTKKSFASMESLALDTGAVAKWPNTCVDIKTYALPKITPQTPPEHNETVIAQSPAKQNAATTNGLVRVGPSILLFIVMFIYCL